MVTSSESFKILRPVVLSKPISKAYIERDSETYRTLRLYPYYSVRLKSMAIQRDDKYDLTRWAYNKEILNWQPVLENRNVIYF